MCAHYDPQIDPARLHAHFGVSDLPLGLKPSLWPGYHGPFLRKNEFADVGDEAVPFRELLVGSFGLIPHWAKDRFRGGRLWLVIPVAVATQRKSLQIAALMLQFLARGHKVCQYEGLLL